MREWLKKLRVDSGLTMKEVGEKLGISEGYYSLIESGNRQKNMDMKLATQLAEIFGVSLDYIAAKEAEAGNLLV